MTTSTERRGPGQPSKGPRTRVPIRFPDELLASLREAAAESGWSVNDEVVARCHRTPPKGHTVSKLSTITADTTVGRLEDIVTQLWPNRPTKVGNNSFTGSEAECETLARELDARGINWGWQ